jgi:hypothetical protein
MMSYLSFFFRFWRKVNRDGPGFAKKVPSVVSGAELYTKSELGAIATSRTLNFPEVGAHFLGRIFMS